MIYSFIDSFRLASTSKGSESQQSFSHIKSILLQDSQNVVCELQLSTQMAESTTWQSVLQSGEGTSYIFRNLKVTQKVTRQRAAGLFSLIDSLQEGDQSAVSIKLEFKFSLLTSSQKSRAPYNEGLRVIVQLMSIVAQWQIVY